MVPTALASAAFNEASSIHAAAFPPTPTNFTHEWAMFAQELASMSKQTRSNSAADPPQTKSAYPTASSSAQFEPLLRLREVLSRYEHTRQLPNPSFVYSELEKPFLSDTPELELCSLSLSIAKRVFASYSSINPVDELNRWTWCCRTMEANIPQVRHQASQLLIACTTTTEATMQPKGKMAQRALLYALIHLLYRLQAGSERSTETELAASRNIVLSLLNRMVTGTLVAVIESIVGASFLAHLVGMAGSAVEPLRSFIINQVLDVRHRASDISETLC